MDSVAVVTKGTTALMLLGLVQLALRDFLVDQPTLPLSFVIKVIFLRLARNRALYVVQVRIVPQIGSNVLRVLPDTNAGTLLRGR